MAACLFLILTDTREEKSPELCAAQLSYAQAVKDFRSLSLRWMLLLFVGIFLMPAIVSVDKMQYVLLCKRVRSMDSTYTKMVQSYPKALPLVEAMVQGGGIWKHLSEGCSRIWLLDREQANAPDACTPLLPQHKCHRVCSQSAVGVAWQSRTSELCYGCV